MKVASVTVNATAHGLTPGFTEVVWEVPVICVAVAIFLQLWMA
jgi:hypothetical protein